MTRRTTRLRSSRRSVRLDFGAIEIIGGLLTPDIIARIAAYEAHGQNEESYSVPPGLKIRDEIARYFRIGEALWARFDAARARSPAASEKFVLDLLKQCFGFDTLRPQVAIHMGEREFPVRHAALDGRVPLVIAPVPPAPARRSGLDESLQQFGDGTRRRSATLLLQEYLNAAEECVWGLATDGLTLRVMRDNVSLTRPAWIEADLSKIFSEGLFPDFSALWLLIHQSRFGKAKSAPAESSLELWRDTGRIEGVAARDKLRRGVEAALIELGQGFIEHPANGGLRQALTDGKLSRQGYFEELLRLVYRLIFLFAAEDRELLHAPGAPQAATKAYADGYSLARLRERCMRRTAWDRHGDAWEGLKATFAALGKGELRLGLPALGGMFADGQLPDLTGCKLDNRRMLAAIWRLAWMRPDGHPLTRVNWRDMETEELGSVYESLLELTPIASADTKTFTFAEGDETRGNARKISGSYYTPDPLVKLLLDGTLEPVLDAAEAREPNDPAAELLKLTIVDPACGSGHFLLAAARRIASRIAKFRSPAAPSLLEFQHALREVVSHCVYGVDRNPMAVELCKVALWIEALEPGRPLTFLDSHIRCGDSLIGLSDLQLLKGGVPDEAYKALTGDIKDVAKACTKFNKAQRDGLTASGFLTELKAPTELIDGARVVIDMPEETVEDIAAKQSAFEGLHSVGQWHQLNIAADLFVAAFFTPKTGDVPEARSLDKIAIPLTSHVWAAVQGVLPPEPLASTAARVARAASAFHWPLEFPHIFGRGGFDAVVGNPPWERIKLQEQEFFAARSPEIALAPTKAAREILIKKLSDSPDGSAEIRLLADFEFAKRLAEASSEFARNSGRYPLTGTGDVNTYALFAEHFLRLARPGGRAGIMVPTGIATDSSTSQFFGALITGAQLRSLYSFYEIRQWFKGTDDRKSFCILCIGGDAKAAEFCFDIDGLDDLANPERRFTLSPDQIAKINPNTKTAPVFRSRADAVLTAKLYDRTPVLIQERPDHDEGDVNPWGLVFQRMFDMSLDSGLFAGRQQMSEHGWECNETLWVRDTEHGVERRLPLYEAKMVHHFDHRWATFANGTDDDEDGARFVTAAEKSNSRFEPDPRHWVPEPEVKLRAARIPSPLKRAWRENSPDRCMRGLAEWLAGYFLAEEGRACREEDILSILGREHAWRAILGKATDRWLMEDKTKSNALIMQRDTPLQRDDITFIKQASKEPLELISLLVERKQPRWLMGWRDIALRSVERTVIGGVLPLAGVGNNLPVWHLSPKFDARMVACFTAMLSSLAFDYIARLKIAGNHLNFFIAQQLPVMPPAAFNRADIEFLTPRVLELTYTSEQMRPWGEDLGYIGHPFSWHVERRSQLRAELDAYIARKWGLSRDELRYILDPADTKGGAYPSETFRVLQASERRDHGEYRTSRLVLQAYDQLEGGAGSTGVTRLEVPIIGQLSKLGPTGIQEGAWSRPMTDQRGEVGAMLVALLKAMESPLSARHVRVAAMLALEPRLLHSQLTKAQSGEWQRLIGDEAKPLPKGTPQFVPPSDQNWGAVVRGLRTRGALVEDAKASTWAPGKGLDKIKTDGWPDGRARFVLDVLRASGDQTLIEALPAELTRWLDAEAA